MTKKILVADDDFGQRDLYVDLFRENGFNVIDADDGLDAWEKIQQTVPDLVFTGILMPRMTGFELVTKMRQDAKTIFTPVIVFSHLGKEEDKQKALSLRHVDFMIKGYDSPAQILSRVKELLASEQKSIPNYNISKPTPTDDDQTFQPPVM